MMSARLSSSLIFVSVFSLTLPLSGLAQPSSYRTLRPERAPTENKCANLSVESHISLSPHGGRSDDAYRTADFAITVFVSNQCPEPVQLLHGSFISYQTNFPSIVLDMPQPPECVGQQHSFSGTVPPFQKAPFVFRAQGCAFPSAQGESPRVTLEAGSILTNDGETPIPTITEVSP